MKIKRINVTNFRHINNQIIELGNKLTVITGQNGTGKSSLLGWLGQACDYKSKVKTVIETPFRAKYSEIFRFCKDKDYSKEYQVSIIYQENSENIEKEKVMKTRYVAKTKKGPERYRVDFDGRGTAINFPVIYLGLKRLIPLATENDISQKNIELDTSEKQLFSTLSKKILILLDKTITSERISSTNKEILAMKTNNYGHLGNSAGQDNIGQIISSLISFKRLKNNEKDFAGGLLLIDEIDATLYAGSQRHLIKELYNFSRDNNIQVVFTTHSLEILEELSEFISEDTKINFLELKNNTIQNKLNPSIKFLKNKIKTQTGQKDKINKINILCEDKSTELWCKNILNGTEYKRYLNIKEGPFGYGNLSNMAESKHEIFKEIYFVLDGDCKEKYKNKLPQRTIILPDTKPPELVFYNFLKNLDDNDEFWIQTDDLNFDKQTCFQDYQKEDLTTAKRWFKDDNFKLLFGTGYARLFNRWKKDNKESVEEFQENLQNLLKI
jgi:AAA15 family ATPase/GTPase